MRWTEEELQYLREHYPDDNTAEIAKHLGRTEGAVQQMAVKHGLRKSAEFMEKTLFALGRQVSHTPAEIANRFKKGQEAFNKGKNRTEWMSDESHEKCMRTTFKHGNIPHNAYATGTEIVRDGRVYVKVPGRRKLMLKQHYVWQQHHGKIPQDHVVKFKDGDFMNCDISNLYIMSRADACVKMINEMSAEQRKARQEVATAHRNETIRKDKMRIRWGLEPKSKIVKKYYAK